MDQSTGEVNQKDPCLAVFQMVQACYNAILKKDALKKFKQGDEQFVQEEALYIIEGKL